MLTDDKKLSIEMMTKMAKLETDVSYIKKSIDKSNIKFDKFVEAVDKKYANKDIEIQVSEHAEKINNINVTLAKWAGGIIVFTTVVGWIISSVA